MQKSEINLLYFVSDS